MKTIALFRGINVGGKNLLPMKSLVEILQKLGYKNVQTYIQSGNVVFQSDKSVCDKEAKKISAVIEQKHGFAPDILFLKAMALEQAIKNNSFPTDIGNQLHFNFLKVKPSNVDFTQIESLKHESESYKLNDRVFYLHAPNGIGRSKLAAKVEKLLGVSATGRNWNTVKKLLKMINS